MAVVLRATDIILVVLLLQDIAVRMEDTEDQPVIKIPLIKQEEAVAPALQDITIQLGLFPVLHKVEMVAHIQVNRVLVFRAGPDKVLVVAVLEEEDIAAAEVAVAVAVLG
jgi:hypothetical protein